MNRTTKHRTTKHRAASTCVIVGLALSAAMAALVIVATPAPALAAGGPVVWAAPNDLGTILSNIRTWLMTILAGIATVFLTIGGVRYLMAGGDPSEVERAKSAFKSAGIGYALAIIAPVILTILDQIVGTP